MEETGRGLLVRDVYSPGEAVVLGVVNLPENFSLAVIRVDTEPCSLVNGDLAVIECSDRCGLT